MPKQVVLVEIIGGQEEAFTRHAAALSSRLESQSQVEKLAASFSAAGVDVHPHFAPVPMFFGTGKPERADYAAFAAFASPTANPDRKNLSHVIRVEADTAGLAKLRQRNDLRVYPASRLYMLGKCACGAGSGGAAVETAVDDLDLEMDFGRTAGGVDCRPFRPAVSRARIRTLLGVRVAGRDGFFGQNIIVAIVDEGVNSFYPVIGGFQSDEAPAPGSAPIESHGSMCAADVLVAAPFARLLDYPLIAEATTADGVQMYQDILERRRQNGTPHIATNSYGFFNIPDPNAEPGHEAFDINHPFHRKVREVIASGAPVFFAAGNCGANCPDRRCRTSATGPDHSINASAALAETITIAAVNSLNERVGYSSQGPSLNAPGFERNKPDFAAYTHFFGNLGPGRPANGGPDSFDSGTSAATPVAAGVAALLMSRFRDLTPDRLRAALRVGAIEVGQPGFDSDTGNGVVNAGASYTRLVNGEV